MKEVRAVKLVDLLLLAAAVLFTAAAWRLTPTLGLAVAGACCAVVWVAVDLLRP